MPKQNYRKVMKDTCILHFPDQTFWNIQMSLPPHHIINNDKINTLDCCVLFTTGCVKSSRTEKKINNFYTRKQI